MASGYREFVLSPEEDVCFKSLSVDKFIKLLNSFARNRRIAGKLECQEVQCTLLMKASSDSRHKIRRWSVSASKKVLH